MKSLYLYATEEFKKNREGKFTHKEIADLLEASLGKKYDRSYITRIENAKAGVKPELAIAIARILKVDANIIFEKENET